MRHLFWGGVHPAGRKELSRGAAPTPAPLPSQVVIPMVQHIGKPCTPLVKAGEPVKLGQKIGDAEGLSATIHASVSGTVAAVEPRPPPARPGPRGGCCAYLLGFLRRQVKERMEKRAACRAQRSFSDFTYWIYTLKYMNMYITKCNQIFDHKVKLSKVYTELSTGMHNHPQVKLFIYGIIHRVFSSKEGWE